MKVDKRQLSFLEKRNTTHSALQETDIADEECLVEHFLGMLLTEKEMRKQADWRTHAYCGKLVKSMDDLEAWFPAKASKFGKLTPEMRERLIEEFDEILPPAKICQICPVQAACLTTAVEHGDIGIWGGTSQSLREEIVKLRDEQLVEIKD